MKKYVLTGAMHLVVGTVLAALMLSMGALFMGVPVSAQYGFMAGAASGRVRSYPVRAYTDIRNFTATTTGTQVTTTPGVLGCVTINTAGAASSTIVLYNASGPVSGYELATIDATQVGGFFCYPGGIFSGQLTVKVTSGGAAPNWTLTYIKQ